MAMNFDGASFLNSILEIIGYKSGVALSLDDLSDFFRKNGYDEYVEIKESDWIRIRSEEFEEIIESLLFSLGRVERRSNRFPSIDLWHKYKHDPKLEKLYQSVMKTWMDWMNSEGRKQMDSGAKLLDPSSIITQVFEKHGPRGAEILMEFFERLNAMITVSPWNNTRQVEWVNEIELKKLFQSEGLEAFYGQFFDQRYIDFLHRNFDAIDRMNWRKFEQLTAEYLAQSGFEIDLGPGRNDDGVDIRAWLPATRGSGPHIIVQCKRQRAAVEKVVVKSLYADLLHEKAASGLIVTTSRVSPGALDTKTARGYKIDVADRETLREWITKMRKPGVGFVA